LRNGDDRTRQERFRTDATSSIPIRGETNVLLDAHIRLRQQITIGAQDPGIRLSVDLYSLQRSFISVIMDMALIYQTYGKSSYVVTLLP
jgi:hypothetical protein